jgi:hypothetical protein
MSGGRKRRINIQERSLRASRRILRRLCVESKKKVRYGSHSCRLPFCHIQPDQEKTWHALADAKKATASSSSGSKKWVPERAGRPKDKLGISLECTVRWAFCMEWGRIRPSQTRSGEKCVSMLIVYILLGGGCDSCRRTWSIRIK